MKEQHEILYENIQRLAYAQGMTVSGLAESAGIRKSVLSDLKAGRNKTLRPATIYKLCEILDCSFADITEEHEDAPMPTKPQRRKTELNYIRIHKEIKERPEIRRLLRVAIKATDKQVRATAILLESIIEGTIGDGGDQQE